MTVGFFLVLRADTAHYLHAAALVKEASRYMPGVDVVQLTDATTPAVPGATVQRLPSAAPLLEQRLTHYAACSGEWLFLDTDVVIRNNVAGVFDDPVFDVALCDRNWPHVPQGEQMLQTMPFNTGVVFSRSQAFWQRALETWRAFDQATKNDWMSEQMAVYHVVRSGQFRVKILTGVHYNYPPNGPDDMPVIAALLHYKGPRKPWRSQVAYQVLSR
jgi:hypothetical protein